MVERSKNVNECQQACMQSILEHPAAIRNRQLTPTCDQHGIVQISGTTTKRRTESYEMIKRIHGCTDEYTLPALSGLVDTLSTKFSKKDLASSFSTKEKLCKHVFPEIYNKEVANFEVTDDNVLRSIATYYTKGVTGKAKIGLYMEPFL